VAVILVSFADVGYRMSVLSISGWSGFSVVAVIAVMSKSCRHAGQLGGVVVGFISGRSEWFSLVLLDGSLRPAAEAALPWR
jgi:fructose-specific phosphotransferase system IIC component